MESALSDGVLARFNQSIRWNRVRNAFFKVGMTEEFERSLAYSRMTKGLFFPLLRERGWCLAQRIDGRQSLWMVPTSKLGIEPAAFCVLAMPDDFGGIVLTKLIPAYEDSRFFKGSLIDAGEIVFHDLPIEDTFRPIPIPKDGSVEVRRSDGFRIAPFHVALHLMGNGLAIPSSVREAIRHRAAIDQKSMTARKVALFRGHRVASHVCIQARWPRDANVTASSPILQCLLPGVPIETLDGMADDEWWRLVGDWFETAFDAPRDLPTGAVVRISQYPADLAVAEAPGKTALITLDAG